MPQAPQPLPISSTLLPTKLLGLLANSLQNACATVHIRAPTPSPKEPSRIITGMLPYVKVLNVLLAAIIPEHAHSASEMEPNNFSSSAKNKSRSCVTDNARWISSSVHALFVLCKEIT
jgi:hypothetical protein